MSKIAIIDAELVGVKKHRFPNLACMKISGYHKSIGDSVVLKMDYKNLEEFDTVYISKVFTDTVVDKKVLQRSNVKYGGTGFYFDKAEPLPHEIEHCKPDYDLYSDWVNEMLESGRKKPEFKYYTDYSIGFLTRGCIRHCGFCVNKNYNQAIKHSPIYEFYDPNRKKICLLDDNFLACKDWKELLLELKAINKPFTFHQGLDIRLMTDEKAELLMKCKTDGDIRFAFDNIEDTEIIEKKLALLRKYNTKKIFKFYVLCGFDELGKYDREFWIKDIYSVWNRISILQKYNCIPYICRYEKFEESEFRGIYINFSRWCNQPSLFKKKSMMDFSLMASNGVTSACHKYILKAIEEIPEMKDWFYWRWEDEH